MANHFKKMGKCYYLTDYQGILLQTMTEIGLVFRVTGEEVELIKYGDALEVRDYYYLYCTEGEVYFFRSKFKDLTQVNKLLEDDSYAKTFYNETRMRMVEERKLNDSNDLYGIHVI